MHELILFLKMCASSGTLIGSLCGLLVVPVAAWVGIRLIAPALHAMTDDPAWQAPLSSLAGTLPGVIFLTLGVSGLLGAARSGCLTFTWGRIIFGFILVLLVLSLVRATASALGRAAELRRLLAGTYDSGETLCHVANRVGVKTRVFDSHLPFCALSGAMSPVVLISSESLRRLDEHQLEAALRHERAHAARHDVLLASLLRFFVDLLPLPTADLISIYHRAREYAADRHASCTEPEHLAAAIIALAAHRTRRSALPALADERTAITGRIEALFDPQPRPPYHYRIIATASLAAIALGSFTPAILSAAHFYHCTAQGMAM